MKEAIPACIVAAALASAPALAAADRCSPGKKHKMHGYYDHPHHHHYRNHHPMHSRNFYPPYPEPYGYGDRPYGKQWPAAEAGDAGAKPQSDATADIVDTAINAGNFTTLVEALKAADLVETLQGPGPFTVFAPSDEAFRKLPETIRTAIVGDKEALKELLTYHVVPGEVSADDVARLNSAETVQGSALSIDRARGIRVDGANIVTADIRATNGIIHVIDTVMIPN